MSNENNTTNQNDASQMPENTSNQVDENAYLWDENGDKIEDLDLPASDSTHPDSSHTDEAQPSDSETKEAKEADKKLRAESFKLASEFGSIGLFLLLAVLFSYYIGKWCDQLFGTKPIFTVFWICCGIAATVLEAIKNIKKASKLDQSEGTKQ